MLSELYVWDSTIEDGGSDEVCSEAYQRILKSAELPVSVAEKASQDGVWSLAAQLLTKHFFKFPTLQMEVLDALLGLCKVGNSQTVRIHTIRSLLALDKASKDTRNLIPSQARNKVRVFIRGLLENERSGVVMRHLTQLDKSLANYNQGNETSKGENVVSVLIAS